MTNTDTQPTPAALAALLDRVQRIVQLTEAKNLEIGAEDGMASLRCSDLAALLAAARRGAGETVDAERYRFMRPLLMEGSMIRSPGDVYYSVHIREHFGATFPPGTPRPEVEAVLDAAIARGAARAAHPEGPQHG